MSSGPLQSWRLLSPALRVWALFGWIVLEHVSLVIVSGAEFLPAASAVLRSHCFDCHAGSDLAGGLNLERLLQDSNLERDFQSWEKVAQAVTSGAMPPAAAPSPTAQERSQLARSIRDAIGEHVRERAGDPGPTALRRLTGAEYGYTIRDLTGLDLQPERGFVNDAVGGAGFTNSGHAQFMEEGAFERYLEAARLTADHAVIGAGPLSFFRDPGMTGRELSAIDRIRRIYRQHGFRTGAGEGAEPFGLDLYPRAMLVAWQYRHRQVLGHPEATLRSLAQAEGISERFAEHLWRVMNRRETRFPLSLACQFWQALPTPEGQRGSTEATVRARCHELGQLLREWQSMLAAAAGDEEEAAVLTAGEIQVSPRHAFVADINWARGARQALVELTVSTAGGQAAGGALVFWRAPRIRFRAEDNSRGPDLPLTDFLSAASRTRLAFGRHPRGGTCGEHDFVVSGESSVQLEILVPPGKEAGQLSVQVELDTRHGDNRIVRCRIADGKVEGETAAEFGASSALLADPGNPEVAEWREGVAEFARLLPEVSHREPAPSDRDPIPPPFDPTYNAPERNHFHTAVKYHRDDAFLVEHLLNDATRRELDLAWTDLLTAFDYHRQIFRFIERKYRVTAPFDALPLTESQVAKFPDEIRPLVQRLNQEYRDLQSRLQEAEAGQVEDVVAFASRAWRRRLTDGERERLRSFYATLRQDPAQSHERALRALLVRVLVSPAFLYRSDSTRTRDRDNTPNSAAVSAAGRWQALEDEQLAERLSYFLWSSIPDQELREAAEAGRLRDPQYLSQQARRMLRDPRARRLAHEFFGQWLGFYRFDQFRGIDGGRFPEFTRELQQDLGEEAVTFCEHLIREDRPIRELLNADYVYVNQRLARHYGLPAEALPEESLVRVALTGAEPRGGVLGMGSILAATSAPLRTSAVKRGDWVLRRLLGTPVPPPPADAGSIAADEVHDDGLTVRRRLEAHRTAATCRNCHSRIDPLGFALENFDPLGRWRDRYRDGQAIETAGTLADGTEIQGWSGLRAYLQREQGRFAATLSSKLLGYALGRAEIAGDQPLLAQMTSQLQQTGRFSDAVVQLVSSTQFRHRRD